MAVDDTMSTAGLDDRVIPFAVPDLDVRGRVVRLGGLGAWWVPRLRVSAARRGRAVRS